MDDNFKTFTDFIDKQEILIIDAHKAGILPEAIFAVSMFSPMEAELMTHLVQAAGLSAASDEQQWEYIVGALRRIGLAMNDEEQDPNVSPVGETELTNKLQNLWNLS